MLLNNKWFGPPLAQWESTHTVRKNTKHKAMMIIITFAVSITILHGRIGLQLMLVGIGLILLWYVNRLKESEPEQ
jgi:uncharacterized membrane protein YbaN (DUF454 family)